MTLRVVLHAPTPAALGRARRNLANLREAAPDAEILLVVNAEAVGAALARPDPGTDGHLRLCRMTLDRQGLAPPPGIRTVTSAVNELARLQAEGWAYVRA
ncbi:MAG: hypothetical protein ACOC3D_00105 [Pseudomonadota bacterium]